MGAYKFFFKYQAETRDHLAYSLIQKSIKPDDTDSDLRRSGELFDLALVITDGEPTARAIEPDRLKLMSINGIHALESAGLVVRAYGIGKIPVFDEIWNGDGIERGKQVASARQLLAATQLLFREELSRRYPGLGVSESAQDG
jgi:hypothetical protein